ncbi:hypothetical protein EJ04DRAFT_263725 [Polyplosphaeria fusca]|uniref:Zn(2)-C6 fungal-type domain-containing protein n=1 Tax=Polyplosphaeria fusca TaxID=682080 RepID=A0A9P4RBJ3_9PLEO|nr:hypothetical protein EJ04DRAFT_263725 [Polyplosphaeria fusca]
MRLPGSCKQHPPKPESCSLVKMYPNSKESKHVACARCRERKVRCDGEKPNCRRCQRHGQSCEYVRGKKQQVKNEWVQHLRTFSVHPAKTKSQSTSTSTSRSKPSPRPIQSEEHNTTPGYLSSDAASFSSRSSSPCYMQTTAPVYANGGPDGSPTLNGASRGAHAWTSSTSAPALSAPEQNLLEPVSFPMSQPPYCDYIDVPNTFSVQSSSNFTSAPPNPSYSLPTSFRADTPGSQMSEERPVDGFFEPSLVYSSPPTAPFTSSTMEWGPYYPSYLFNRSSTAEF